MQELGNVQDEAVEIASQVLRSNDPNVLEPCTGSAFGKLFAREWNLVNIARLSTQTSSQLGAGVKNDPKTVWNPYERNTPGSVIAKVNKLLQRDSRFEIETPTATSFVRGTELRVKVEDQGETRLEVLEGAVDFGSSDNNISVGGNFGSLVKDVGNTPVSPHALPMAPSQLFTPAEREVLDGDIASYRFSWSAVNGSKRYHLEISSYAEFKQLVDET